MTLRHLTAIIEREGNGYVSLCPELDVASQGDSIEEVRQNLREALELFFETASAEEIQRRVHQEIYVTSVEVAERCSPRDGEDDVVRHEAQHLLDVARLGRGEPGVDQGPDGAFVVVHGAIVLRARVRDQSRRSALCAALHGEPPPVVVHAAFIAARASR